MQGFTIRDRTVCLTGHRNIDAGEQAAIRTRLRYLVDDLIRSGCRYFGVGGAQGFDMLAAEYLIQLRDSRHDIDNIKVISVIPFEGWMEDWPEEMKIRERRILKASDKVVVLSKEYHSGVYYARDRHLVDSSSVCVSYCRHKTGGTAYTVRYAMAQGLKCYNTSSWDITQLGR